MVKIFGVRLEIFYYTGLITIICYSILLYATSKILLNRFGATIATLLFLSQLAFFNTEVFTYVFPYFYGAIFGSFLFFLELFLLLMHMKKNNKRIYLWFAALIAVICFIIKQDFFLASTGLLIFYFILEPLRKIGTEDNQSAKWYFKNYIKSFNYNEFIKVITFVIVGCGVLFS